MFRLRRSIVWQMIFWFFILSLISVSVVFVSMQSQMRQSNINITLENMKTNARIYADRVQAQPARSVELGIAMSNETNGDLFYLLASDGTYSSNSDATKIGRSAKDDLGSTSLDALLETNSTTIFDRANGLLISSYRKAATDPLAVSVSTLERKGLANIFPSNATLILVVVMLVLTTGGMWLAGNTIYNPLAKLIDHANNLSQGKINALPEINTRGDLKNLANSLQIISANLEKSSNYMDSRFEERSYEFERRSTLLKAVADVGKAITSFRNVGELLEKTTHLIHDHFGYYHVGIFLLDEHKEYAVLSAANSEGGKRMLQKKHQLKVGAVGIVGYVTQSAKARIALDVGEDAVYFDNPDLPNTHSEMALPLVVGGQILGALDVQSTEEKAFTEEDISTLQILAEQLAVAIQNANLLNETEKALESARNLTGDMSREAWSKILRDQPRIGFIATPPGTVQTYSENLEPNLARALESGDVVIGSDNMTIGVPIKIRGQAIGAIRLKKSEIAETWTQDEINLATALSDQLTGALESARLYKESQQRGARESLVSDISARISAASHTEAILRETVQELGQTIGNATVTFQLLDNFSTQKQVDLQESEYTPGADEKAGA